MIGFGVPGTWSVLGAISAPHHGWTIFWANHTSRGHLRNSMVEEKNNLMKCDWGYTRIPVFLCIFVLWFLSQVQAPDLGSYLDGASIQRDTNESGLALT